MTAIISVFLALTVLWLCYWTLVRPVVLDSAQDELSRMKSKLDWAIINGEIGSRSQAAQMLGSYLSMPASIRYVSIGMAIKHNLTCRAEIAAIDAKEGLTFEASPVWIREMWERHTVLCMKSALSNSPAWWPPLSVILLVCFFSRQVENWWRHIEIATSRQRD